MEEKMADLPNKFDELITGNEIPVLVDFYADWCGPCKMVSPIIARIAREFKGRITTVKINTEKKAHIAAQYSIQSIPTIMMFYKGKQLMRLQGAYPYEALKAEIEKSLRTK